MVEIEEILGEEFTEGTSTGLIEDSEVMLEMTKKIEKAHQYYDNLRDFRDRAKVSRDFYEGKQWNQLLKDEDGNIVTEEERIIQQGKQPLKNNQIQQLVKNLIGQFRDNDYKNSVISRKREDASVSEMMTYALEYVYDNEELKELDTREFEEFLISGLPGWKLDYGWNDERRIDDPVISKINRNRIFFNTDIQDPRMKDLRFIGELIDADLEEVVRIFGEGKEDQEELIREWYAGDYEEKRASMLEFGTEGDDNVHFLISEDPSKVRLFEIWEYEVVDRVKYHDLAEGTQGVYDMSVEEALEMVEMENEMRMQGAIADGIDPQEVQLIHAYKDKVRVWHYYYLTPQGHVLDAGETPYKCGNPYVLRPYPMVDRKVWGFIETIIDQQIQINRLITLMDFMLGAGSKGVLLFPEEMKPAGMTKEDLGKEWTKFNGMIMYSAKDVPNGHKPEQINSNSQSAAGQQLLALQLQLLKEISGVTEAIQGQKPNSGTPASLYAQMTNQAALSSKDYFEHFFNARKIRDRKIVQLIQQFWTEERYINVSGADYENEAYVYKPEKVEDALLDIVIARSGQSPMYRMMMDEKLDLFLGNGLIDFEMYLKNTSLPFADKLLQEVQERKQEGMEQAQAMQSVLGDKIQNLEGQVGNAQVDPKLQSMFNQMIQN